MLQSDWLRQVQAAKAIAVIRAPEVELAMQLAKAVAAGGMRLIEITWNSKEPVQLIQRLRIELPDCLIGAGTLLTSDDLQAAIAAGAQFLFTPYSNPQQIQLATEQQIPIVPGALSPTEIVTAWQAGANCVKVFPIQAVGGADYIRQLQGPIGQIPLIPTGGVTLENARSLLEAGAIAIGLSGQLFPRAAIEQQDWGQICDRAGFLMQQLHHSA